MATWADRVVLQDRDIIGKREYIAQPETKPLGERLIDALRVLTGRYSAIKYAKVEDKLDKNYTALMMSDEQISDAINTVNKQHIEIQTGRKCDENDRLNVGRNEPCICGSKKKYKKCCGQGD